MSPHTSTISTARNRDSIAYSQKFGQHMSNKESICEMDANNYQILNN